MKICPKCNETYADDNLNFCISDGEYLVEVNNSEASPTMVLDNPEIMSGHNWRTKLNPETPRQSNPSHPPQQIVQDQQIYRLDANSSTSIAVGRQNKNLATASLYLGILSIVMFCCNLGIPLGMAAMITGFFGIKKINTGPQHYGGEGLAIIGMVLGGVGFFLTVLGLILRILI